MGVLDIIYNMVNKSRGKKKKKKARKKKNKTQHKKNSPNTQQKVVQKVVVKDMSNTAKMLKAWDNNVKNLSDHPLSQFKVVNTQVLEQLTDILTSMNLKMDKLTLLDDILALLKESRTEIRIVGGSTEKLDKAIAKLEGLTIKDEEVLRVLSEKGPKTADELASLIGISRSTASSRLNRLNKMKVVKKKADGKLIYYSLYSKKKD
jgi:DNA-binding transcriptional ArsR family regulator